MASVSVHARDVELLESEIIKPQPLRIIKRSQTITSCSTPREDVVGRRKGRSSSRATVSSQGSPKMEYDGPLTIRKKRLGKSRILTATLNDSEMDMSCENILEDFDKQQYTYDDPEDDPEITPKAVKGVIRTVSAGAFLRSELHQRSSEIDATRYSVRGDRSNFCSQDQNVRPTSTKKGPPPIPERRPSKSKNFFLRALAGQNHNILRKEHTAPIQLVDIKDSKNGLTRRLSRSKRKTQNNPESFNHSSNNSISTYANETQSSDINDMGTSSMRSSLYVDSVQLSPMHTPVASSHSQHLDTEVLVLCPQIVITPEVQSVDTRGSYVWVAVEIRGQLRKADGEYGGQEVQPSYQSTMSPLHDLRHYGQLHSMHISLDLGLNCVLNDTVGDLDDIKTIKAHETQLLLIKVQFNATSPLRHVRESSSRDLMNELQHDLGETTTKYLTVRLHYEHTGFISHKNFEPDCDGTVSQSTHLSTEATAIIRRHNPQSAWSPRASQTVFEPFPHNPLISIIEWLLPVEEARAAIRKISAERPLISCRRFATVTGSSEETVKPRGPTIMSTANSTIASYTPPPTRAAPARPTDDLTPPPPIPRREEDEMDPARKIWTEMRRHSRRHDHVRKSISADHYMSLEDEAMLDHIRTSSGESAKTDIIIETQRGRIREAALRNKRSVGQETLRSMAPSVFGSELAHHRQAGSMGVLGLGAGKSWWTHFGW